MARKLRETLTDSRDLQWADATGVLSKARQVIKDEPVAIDPQRWQCCMTSDFLALAKSGREDEAMEVLLDGLLGKDSKGTCSNIAECVSGGCQLRNQSRHDSAENRNGQDRGGLTP